MGKDKAEDPIPSTPPLEQLHDEVRDAYNAYMADKTTMWKARCATYLVGHFAEHVHKYYKHHDKTQLHGRTGKAEKYVEYLAKKRCPELQILWELALASKHRFTRKKIQRTVPSTSGVVGVDTNNISTATESFTVKGSTDSFVARGPTGVPGSSGSGDTKTEIVEEDRLWLTHYDCYFDDVLFKAMRFWEEYLPTLPTYS